MQWIKVVWNKLSPDGKAATAIGLALLIVAILAIPGVVERKSEKTPPSQDDQPKQQERTDPQHSVRVEARQTRCVHL